MEYTKTQTSKVDQDHQLTTAQIREYILEQFDIIKREPSIQQLIWFHSVNKYLLMAFNQELLRVLGNITSNKYNIPIEEVYKEYEKYLNVVLYCTPTPSRHANVLRKMFGYFRKKLPKYKAERFEDLIFQYQKGIVSLGSLLYGLNSFASEYDNSYIARQTYYLLYSDSIPPRLRLERQFYKS